MSSEVYNVTARSSVLYLLEQFMSIIILANYGAGSFSLKHD
jgi:hypothetical protein